jgi:hypothetical protein
MQIPYMLSGSIAMNLYAEPRNTQDIDLVVEMLTEDIPFFVKLLGDRFYFDEQTMYEEVQRKGMFNIIHFESGYKVDFIIRKNEVYEQVKFQRRSKTTHAGITFWVISAEDLVVSKLQWIQVLESEKQKRDIANLLENEQLDREYIQRWCEILNLKTYNLL